MGFGWHQRSFYSSLNPATLCVVCGLMDSLHSTTTYTYGSYFPIPFPDRPRSVGFRRNHFALTSSWRPTFNNPLHRHFLPTDISCRSPQGCGNQTHTHLLPDTIRRLSSSWSNKLFYHPSIQLPPVPLMVSLAAPIQQPLVYPMYPSSLRCLHPS